MCWGVAGPAVPIPRSCGDHWPGDQVRSAGGHKDGLPPAVMQQEQKFYKALEEVTGWEPGAPSGQLLLTDADGTVLMSLAPRRAIALKSHCH